MNVFIANTVDELDFFHDHFTIFVENEYNISFLLFVL